MELREVLVCSVVQLLVCLSKVVVGQGSTATSLGCDALTAVEDTPSTGATSKNEATPFSITPAEGLTHTYSPGGQIKVILQGNQDFSSVIIQSLHNGPPKEMTGSWSRDSQEMVDLTCAVNNDSVTHTLSSPANKITLIYNLKDEISDPLSIFFTAAVIDIDGKVRSNITSASWTKHQPPAATTLRPETTTDTTILGLSQVTFSILVIAFAYVGMYTIFSFLLI